MSDESRKTMGPNVKKLMINKMALLAIPPGTDDAFGAGLAAITTPGTLAIHAKAAIAWVYASIDAIKAASDNPYGQDDEKIAEAINVRVEARQAELIKKLKK